MGKLVILSGAGISAESGIQTFRAADGLWNEHRVEDICYLPTWKANAPLVHRFYNGRREQLAAVAPNAFHHAVARWQGEGREVVCLTQNVDDLLERAGVRDVVHLHGRLEDMHCLGCGHQWSIGGRRWTYGDDACPKCFSATDVKPGVIFFGENAPAYARLHATIAALTADDVCLVTGTSLQVLPFDVFLLNAPGFKVLNAMDLPVEHSMDRNHLEQVFDAVLEGRCTQFIELLDQMLVNKLGPATR